MQIEFLQLDLRKTLPFEKLYLYYCKNPRRFFKAGFKSHVRIWSLISVQIGFMNKPSLMVFTSVQ